MYQKWAKNEPGPDLNIFLVDALKCYSCGSVSDGPNGCDTDSVLTCTNSTYCLSKYATINDRDIVTHSCAQELFEDDFLGMS